MTRTNPSGTAGTLAVTVLKETPSGPVHGLQLPLVDDSPAGPFKMSFWRLNPGEWSDWDQHEVLEVWMVATGTGTVWREADATRVTVGDVVFMPSLTRHRLHNDGTERMELFSVWWQHDPQARPDV
jgi:mannose-6-phosphate isomerase-like protein (cupin superfamily)